MKELQSFDDLMAHAASVQPLPDPASAAASSLDLCPYWKQFRILAVLVANLWFLPATLKTIASNFIAKMDAQCP